MKAARRKLEEIHYRDFLGVLQEDWRRACERLNGGIAVVRRRRESTWRAGGRLESAGVGKDLMEVIDGTGSDGELGNGWRKRLDGEITGPKSGRDSIWRAGDGWMDGWIDG